jgi:alpha-beta hydrolase superfamily lysophospholipase
MVLSEASEFRYLGYDVLLIDFRGHGNSGGNTTTIGIRESEEINLAYEFAKSKNPRNIFVWGNSMGAVAVAKAVADYGIKPAGLMLEMPFASLQSHLQSKARALGFSGMPEKPFGFFVTLWIGIERGVGAFGHKTSRYMKKITCPVLMQWGEEDRYVLRKDIDKVFASIASSSKTLAVYPTGGHESLLLLDPVKWRSETEKFLAANTR